MSVAYGKGNKGKATKLHSQLIRNLGYCERCFVKDVCDTNHTRGCVLQAAHIIGRRYSATRTLLNNAWSLCGKCHRELTDWPSKHMDFIGDTFAYEVYKPMSDWAQDSKRRDWPTIKFNENEWAIEYERLQELKEIPLKEARTIEWQQISN